MLVPICDFALGPEGAKETGPRVLTLGFYFKSNAETVAI